MKIIALTAENIKRLTAVHIEPSGRVVQITGKNGAGKTSVLDSIWWALTGATHIQASPIRKGAASARIRLDLGEIIVTRSFAAKDDGGYTTALAVENADGARFPSPQKMLDSLLGELSFDPLAFARMKPKEQFDALKTFVPGVDFEAIDRANAGDFERRAATNKRAKEARTTADAIKVSEQPPAQRVDEAELVQKMQDAGEHNRQLEQRKGRRAQHAARIDNIRDAIASDKSDVEEIELEIVTLQKRIDTLRVAIATKEQNLADLEQQLNAAEALPKPIDVTVIATQLNEARDINRVVDEWEKDRQRKNDLYTTAAALEKQSDELTAARAEREQQKQAAIAKAHLPVDGLGFGDGFVTFNGVPFEQASDAEQLRASVAIAAAMNPKLRVIRVRDGSLLDDDGMRLLAEMAEKHDMQMWIERVDSSGKIGFVLEDGTVKQTEASAA